MSEAENRGDAGRKLLGRGWRNVRAAGLRRLVITAALLVLALLLARFSWYDIFVISDAERALYDLRAYSTAPRVDQDQRIQIVVYNDETLIAAKKRSPPAASG